MSATEKIMTFINSQNEPFTFTEVSRATEVGISQVRPIVNALIEQGKVELVSTKRTKLRGRPANAFIMVPVGG